VWSASSGGGDSVSMSYTRGRKMVRWRSALHGGRGKLAVAHSPEKRRRQRSVSTLKLSGEWQSSDGGVAGPTREIER
jgi:hypothetical protein